ncbi:hypothetical protein BSPWISOXPB_9230, partial [uncultured Gammaproteobacteria bacterium]
TILKKSTVESGGLLNARFILMYHTAWHISQGAL